MMTSSELALGVQRKKRERIRKSEPRQSREWREKREQRESVMVL